MTLAEVFLVITGLFALFLVLKKWFPKICVICAAVALTWLVLLFGYHSDWFEDRLLLGLLMGQSITGIYYLLVKKMPEQWRIFQLPLLLSLTYILYVAVILEVYASALIVIVGLWALFSFVYFSKNSQKLNRIAKKIIECCKDW